MDKRLEEIEGGPVQTPRWEFNGEILVNYGSALTPTGRGYVLKVLNDYESLSSIIRQQRDALMKYGTHIKPCVESCDCGLFEALSGAEEKK